MFHKHYSFLLIIACGFLSGCCFVRPISRNQQLLSASQLRSQELFSETQSLAAGQQNLHGALQAANGERVFLSQQLGQLQSQLTAANSRIENLLVEREELKGRHLGLLLNNQAPILSGNINSGPPINGFQRDELTGLNRYESDILFDLGKADLRSESYAVIKEFAARVQAGDAVDQKILVVGHTDDQAIQGGYTAVKHPTNWHLSTDRAGEVIQELIRLGVAPTRIAAMGYSKFQPRNIGTDETIRQRNRRVELYLVPISANVAQWDPASSLN